MHKEGWLSGSLYLERPEKIEEHDGDIIFSLHGSNYPMDKKEYPTKIINIDFLHYVCCIISYKII